MEHEKNVHSPPENNAIADPRAEGPPATEWRQKPVHGVLFDGITFDDEENTQGSDSSRKIEAASDKHPPDTPVGTPKHGVLFENNVIVPGSQKLYRVQSTHSYREKPYTLQEAIECPHLDLNTLEECDETPVPVTITQPPVPCVMEDSCKATTPPSASPSSSTVVAGNTEFFPVPQIPVSDDRNMRALRSMQTPASQMQNHSDRFYEVEGAVFDKYAKGQQGWIGNFIVEALSKTVYILVDTDHPEIEYTLAIRYGHQPMDYATVIVKKLELNTLLEKIHNLEILVRMNRLKNNLASIVQEYAECKIAGMESSGLLPTSFKTRETGWHCFCDRWFYLYRGRSIPFCKNTLLCENNCSLIINPAILPGNCFEILRQMLSIGDLKVTAPCVAFMLIGLMFRLFAEANHRPTFALFLYGTTGSLKTSFAREVFRFLDFTGAGITHTFRDTSVALELFLGSFSDCVGVVDDFNLGESNKEQKQQLDNLNVVARMVGDSISKSRGTSDLKMQTTKCARGAVAMTGEIFEGKESTLLRLHPVRCGRESIHGERLDYFQKNTTVWPTFCYHFVQFLEVNFCRYVEYIRRNFENFRLQNRDMARRTVDQVTVYALTLKILGDFLSIHCKVPQTDVEEVICGMQAAITLTFQEGAAELTAANPSFTLLNALHGIILDQDVLKQSQNEFFTAFHDKRILGYLDEDRGLMTLVRSRLHIATLDEYRKHGKRCSLEESDIIRELDQIEELVIHHRNGPATTTRRRLKIPIPGAVAESVNVVDLNLQVLQKCFENV